MYLANYASPYNNKEETQDLNSNHYSPFATTKKRIESKTHSKTQKVQPFSVDNSKVKAILDKIQKSVEDINNENEINDNDDNDDDTNNHYNNNTYQDFESKFSKQLHSKNTDPFLPPPKSDVNRTKFNNLHNHIHDNDIDDNDIDNIDQFQNIYENTHTSPEFQKHISKEGMRNQPMNMGEGGSSDLLTKKLNYIIHLLEEQQDEKTNNVTEEKILYMFLGVFIIFIVDSFAKVGKYVR